MNHECSKPIPQLIEKSLEFNDSAVYKRIITGVHWISSERLPYVFHSAGAELNQISPAYCQSFDYKLFGKVVPVTYVLPWPHVNRVRTHSEVWGLNKKEGYERNGISYTYLRVENNGLDYGQIRMGSTMLDQYLLAAKNSGMVFSVSLTEVSEAGLRSRFKEYISLANLQVVDVHRFCEPSPFGYGGMGGIETHVPLDIYRPELNGFQSFREYIDRLRTPSQRRTLIDTANQLLIFNPNQLLHGIFKYLVKENYQALMRISDSKGRLLLNLNED